ncbi:glycosyltransferase family 4 protein [Candidatus Nitrosocosmicus oleophilus]|uniref:glycosyltransferase family 4 protein n=1 Tax=Candidatus Nitrosocosmicus oleophilus TaxID=1353260 RepID=UPI0018CB70D6|nr:glycosyltransferase family 4 protein [Candidatus Nitrosocosmicus oleophilus]
MKILQVTPFFPPDIGGISDHVYAISKNLQLDGHDVTIIAPHKITERNNANDINKLIKIPSLYLLPWPYSTLKNFSFPVDLGMRIDKIIKNGNFDLVHTHGQHYPTSWLAIRSSKKYGVPCILTIHTNFALNPKRLGGKTKIEEYFNKLVFARILGKTTGIIGLTANNISYAKLYAKGDKYYYQISNGINNQLYYENSNKRVPFREAHGLSNNTPIILFCGRFEDVKGILEFAEASRQLASNFQMIKVIMIGNGSLKEQIVSIIRDEPNIILINWQSHEELIKYYIMSDIFVIPSKFEGLPIVLLEAMAASMHIVYTPVGSMPEVLEKYPMKSMIKSCTADEIYRTIEGLLNNFEVISTNEKKVMNYMERFDWRNITRQVEFAYRQTINQDHLQ